MYIPNELANNLRKSVDFFLLQKKEKKKSPIIAANQLLRLLNINFN